jgi:hypothetical protein
LNTLDAGFERVFRKLMEQVKTPHLHLDYSTGSIVSYLMHNCTAGKKDALDLLYPDCVFN